MVKTRTSTAHNGLVGGSSPPGPTNSQRRNECVRGGAGADVHIWFTNIIGDIRLHVSIKIDLRFRTSHTSAFLRIQQLLGPDIMTPAMADEGSLGEFGYKLLLAFTAPKSRDPPMTKKIKSADRFVDTTIGYPTIRASRRVSRLVELSRGNAQAFATRLSPRLHIPEKRTAAYAPPPKPAVGKDPLQLRGRGNYSHLEAA
jgi:hypothetical protein